MTRMLFLLVMPLLILADDLGDQLLSATRKGDVAQVTALLDKGADINAKTRYKQTPLFFACDRGNADMVKLLIARGAALDLEDTFYHASPISWAMSKNHEEIVKMLIEAGANPSDPLKDSIRNGNKARFAMVLDKGKLTPEMLNDALLIAAFSKRDEMAKALEGKGARKVEFPADEQTLKSYEGKFEEGGTSFVFGVKDGKLTITIQGAPVDLVPSAKDRFKWIQQSLEFTFERDDKGVTAVRFASRGGDMKLKKVN